MRLKVHHSTFGLAMLGLHNSGDGSRQQQCSFKIALPGDLCTAPGIISLSSLSLATDVTDVTLGASGFWLGTRTGAGGTVTLA